nr:ribonuclease H-like domain-containing protein [Tanacetum cinerariifolium]
MSDHEDETIPKENAHPKVVPQIITVTNIFAKFLYLKKGEYDIWAMKMQNFISSSDLLCWNIVLKGNSVKSMTIDNDGNLNIRPPVTAEEHQQGYLECHQGKIWIGQRLFQDVKDPDSDEHFKDKAQSIRCKHEILEGIAFFLVWLFIKFFHPSNAAFVSTAGSSQGNLSYQESGNGDYTTSCGSSSSKGSSKSKCNVVNDVIYSFFANHEIDQHLVYEDLDQINKEDFEE